MKTFVKTFIYLLVGAFVFLLLILNVRAQELTQDEAKEVELLKAKNGLILEDELITPDNFDTKTGKITEQTPYIRYSYIGEEVKNASNIIFTNNKNYSNTIKENNLFYFWPAPKFYRDENNFIKEIKTEITTQKIWQESNVKSSIEKIISILKTPYVNAESYYTYGRGRVRNNGADWSTTHNSATGTGVENNAGTIVPQAVTTGGNYYIDRAFISFDTSALADTITISSSTLILNIVSNQTAPGIDLVSATNAVPVTTADFNKIGTTKLATTASGLVTGGYGWLLNSSGRSNISLSTTTKFAIIDKRDFDNSGTADLYNTVITDGAWGTSTSPILMVSTEAGMPTSTPTSTPTSILTCTPDTNLDIGVITSCAFATSGVTYTNYNLPILLYLYIVSLFLACYATFFMFKK